MSRATEITKTNQIIKLVKESGIRPGAIVDDARKVLHRLGLFDKAKHSMNDGIGAASNFMDKIKSGWKGLGGTTKLGIGATAGAGIGAGTTYNTMNKSLNKERTENDSNMARMLQAFSANSDQMTQKYDTMNNQWKDRGLIDRLLNKQPTGL